MKRLRIFLIWLVAIILLLSLIGGAVWLVRTFFGYVSSVPKELGAALVAAGTTIFVATATVMIGRYYERKKELDALYRDKKIEIYDEFLKKFFGLFFDQDNSDDDSSVKDLAPFLQEFTRKLVLWSGPEVIEAFVRWKDHLGKGIPDAQSIFLTEEFLKSIRNDLRHSNKGLNRGFFAKLFMKDGNLFLELSAENPNMTLAALVEIEKNMHK